MRFTMKGDYGLRAMIDLAAHVGRGPVPSAAIAARQRIPEQFLDQVLVALRRAGLLRSQRGPQGGHMLARSASAITMADVLHALEGETPTAACVPNPGGCAVSPGCAIRDVWSQIDDFARELMRTTTVAQLAERQQAALVGREGMYYI